MFVLGLVEEYTIIMITQFTVHDDAIARAVRRSSGSKYPVGGYRWRELLPSAPIAMPNTKSIFNIPFFCSLKRLFAKNYIVGYILTEMRNLRYDGAQLEGRFVLLQAPYDCVELGAGSAESAADGRSA